MQTVQTHVVRGECGGHIFLLFAITFHVQSIGVAYTINVWLRPASTIYITFNIHIHHAHMQPKQSETSHDTLTHVRYAKYAHVHIRKSAVH